MNIATGGRVSLLDLVNQLNNYLDTDFEPQLEDERPGDIKHSRADIDRAGELLGYEPVVTFEAGLERTVRWFREAFDSVSA
jgi:nucleoside-diphosphate-sugar epimerase